ncbi:MAG: DEAD/DEAH box helicase family protein [Nitrospinae bacterium]|nr:DEAD/DEAH box helicase family protein [Nitrospinota bacterium]
MNASPVVNPGALEPLYKSWEEPDAHRIRSEEPGAPAKIVKGRRKSPVVIAQNLRAEVSQWRESSYFGVSDTTRYLLEYWFGRSHIRTTPAGDEFEFRYYFCQREAIETLIYLKEVRKLEYLSQIFAGYGGANAETLALGITEEEDAWTRYAFKLATGSGKTKVMSLAVVWSYFHSLRESDSPMARHFVMIAPNLTVFERLKEDFGNGKIFDEDPLVPTEWRGDWNLSVVLQDEAGGAATGGVLYLTNIHRLYNPNKRKEKKEAESYPWMGPPVSKAKALDTGASLRDRITGHRKLMVLNDEAHHVWDPDSAWNEAIKYLHDAVRKRTGGGLVAQLDFSATPKDNCGNVFKHVVCDSPLGEAVDGGIVKTPVIGKSGKLVDRSDPNAAYKYEQHLRIGYERWKASREEWEKSGKKALLFVMCDDTQAADEISQRLNTDEAFKELNGKTINLHTNLKGKVKTVGRGQSKSQVFVEDEKEISDEDLKALRKLSRELDSNVSPHRCIVSVLMLREGWDVRNVTTIVPLRPYSSKANILPEQTLGRGLRRMTPSGQAHELVTVVEHPAFSSLYQQELAHEGLPVEIIDIDKIPSTTVSIFPDPKKDLKKLDIQIPILTPEHRPVPKLEGLTLEDVKKAFKRFKPLPLGAKGNTEIEYEGRALFTGEIVEKMRIRLPLLESGFGAVSYFVTELEHVCKLRGTHQTLAPLIQTFLEEILFERRTTLDDPHLVARLSDSDVHEHVRATFVPLIRERTIKTGPRKKEKISLSLANWKPYPATHNERRPALGATRTLFNLVPCNRELEVAMTQFLDRAPDIKAFAKNQGPQCLRIDYLTDGKRLAFYTPDFFARNKDGNYYLIETKGREDRDVPLKARAAVAWCRSASTGEIQWEYVYVQQGVFERLTGAELSELTRSCNPALQDLLKETEGPQMTIVWEEEAPATGDFIDPDMLKALPSRYKKASEEAITLFKFFENKEMNFAPVFTALFGSLDEATRGLVDRRLSPEMPTNIPAQKDWFEPYYGKVDFKMQKYYQGLAQNLKRTLVFKNGVSPIGLLRSCLDFALNDKTKIGGVFEAVRKRFQVKGGRDILALVERINEFRNTYIAHQEKELKEGEIAGKEMKVWIEGLKIISEAE